jgi:hypothetical protein
MQELNKLTLPIINFWEIQFGVALLMHFWFLLKAGICALHMWINDDLLTAVMNTAVSLGKVFFEFVSF